MLALPLVCLGLLFELGKALTEPGKPILALGALPERFEQREILEETANVRHERVLQAT